MRVPAEALSALCNGEIRGTTLPSYLVGFLCLSVTMVTADLYCLWNRVYSSTDVSVDPSSEFQYVECTYINTFLLEINFKICLKPVP